MTFKRGSVTHTRNNTIAHNNNNQSKPVYLLVWEDGLFIQNKKILKRNKRRHLFFIPEI